MTSETVLLSHNIHSLLILFGYCPQTLGELNCITIRGLENLRKYNFSNFAFARSSSTRNGSDQDGKIEEKYKS